MPHNTDGFRGTAGNFRHGRAVYVDPYGLAIRGTLTTWYDETPLMTWLDDLHRNLHLGAVGRAYSELGRVPVSWRWILENSGSRV